jgi:O-antigen ligase
MRIHHLLLIQALFLFPPAGLPDDTGGSSPGTWQFWYAREERSGLITARSPEKAFFFDAPRDVRMVELYGFFFPAALPPGGTLLHMHLMKGGRILSSHAVPVPRHQARKHVLYYRAACPESAGIDGITLRADPEASARKGFRIRIKSIAAGRGTSGKPRAKVLDFHPKSWHREIVWDFSGPDPPDWICLLPDARCFRREGILFADITAGGETMGGPVLDGIRARSFPFMEIRMKTDTAVGRGYVYWTTDDAPDMVDKRRLGFRIKGSSKFRRYILHLSDAPAWTGRISRLFLVPLDHEGRVAIDSITLFDAPLIEYLDRQTGRVRKDYLLYIALILWLVLLVIGRLTGQQSSIGRWNERVLGYGLLILLVTAALFPFDFYPGLKIKFAGVKFIPPVAVLLFFGLFRLFSGKNSREKYLSGMPAAAWCFIFFLAFSCLSWARSGFDPDGLRYLVQYILASGLVYFLARALMRDRGAAWRGPLLKTVLGLGMLLSLLGLMSFFIRSDLFYDHFYKIFAQSYYQVPIQRISASLIHPTVLGSFLLFPLSVALSYLMVEKRKARKGFGAAGLLVILPAIFLTFSRGCWLCAALVILLFVRHRGWKSLLAAALLMLTLLALTLFSSGHTRDALGNRLSVMREEARHRVSGLLTAGRIGLSNPFFGVGPGSFLKHESSYRVVHVEKDQVTWKTPDNMYLRLFAETGLPGLVLFLCFLLTALKKTAGSGPEAGPGEKAAAAALRAAGLGFAVNLLFYDGLYWFPPMLLFFLFLGTASGARQARPER